MSEAAAGNAAQAQQQHQQQQQQHQNQQNTQQNQQQQQEQALFDTLSEEIQINYPGLKAKNWKSVNDVAKAYANAEKQLTSSDKVSIPSEINSMEDIYHITNRLGRPADFDAEAYSFNAQKGSPDFMNPSSEFSQKMLKVAHYLGLTPTQARGLMTAQSKLLTHTLNEQRQEH